MLSSSQSDVNATDAAQSKKMEGYYQLHSKIYDATRWSFLFGRNRIIDLAAKQCQPKRILEIGCGTGKNIKKLLREFPDAKVLGIDAAKAMIDVAEKELQAKKDQVELIHGLYEKPLGGEEKYDMVLISYCLTMVNPGWEGIVDVAIVGCHFALR